MATDGGPAEDDADLMSPFERWQWETDGFVAGKIGKPSQIFYSAYSDAQGSILKRLHERWFAAGMTTEEASEKTILMLARLGALKGPRTWAEYPDPPRLPNGNSMVGAWELTGGGWRVLQDREMLAVYNPTYYVSIDEVIDDLTRRLATGEVRGRWGHEYVVWFGGRIAAVVRASRRGTRRKAVRFPGDLGEACDPRPDWPTREQWIASGRGPLWFDGDNPENQPP